MKGIKSEAVSPVVGVMLMLVVTIIIAAVVSAFAGGMAGEQQKAPQASISAKAVIGQIEDTDTSTWGPNYPADFSAVHGIEFEHKGGEAFSLDEIKIQLEHSGVSMIVSSVDELPDSTCLPASTTDGGYFWKIGNTTLSDKTVSSGDKFMFYADNCYISGVTDYILWTFDTGYGYGVVGDLYDYSIIDANSGQKISSGKVLLK
ncbi:MAG: type IV pilin N-terminal domain-containing protein [Methanomicrobiaceae archaeon]|nr:type IV pilin N-terminal domain-containing protein [Methanomicrobiaceae archaeon]